MQRKIVKKLVALSKVGLLVAFLNVWIINVLQKYSFIVNLVLQNEIFFLAILSDDAIFSHQNGKGKKGFSFQVSVICEDI